MSEKIYVGSGKEFGQYGTVNLNLCLSDIPKEHIFEYNGKKYIKLKTNKKRETDQYGKTHSLEVDTWKPNQEQQIYNAQDREPTHAQNHLPNQAHVADMPEDSLPF